MEVGKILAVCHNAAALNKSLFCREKFVKIVVVAVVVR